MAHHDDASTYADLLARLGDEGTKELFRRLLEQALQDLIDAELTAAIGADRHQRSESRSNYRNGGRSRLLSTPAGDVELRIPKVRVGSFFPALLEPRRRVDKALWAQVMTAYICGTSTRKVDDLVRALGCDTGVSKSTVSRICAEIDEQVEAFRTRSLDHITFPYVFLDATYVKDRGLSGVVLVISDAHSGLKAAISRVFQGAAWQRCKVHLMRNLLAHVPKHHKEMIAATVRTVFAQPDPASTRDQLRQVVGMLEVRYQAAAELLTEAEADVTAYASFPQAHWRKIASTNPLERVHKEIKRRSNVVGIFPDDTPVLRLVGAVLIEVHDDWQTSDRRYLSEGSMKLIGQNTKEVTTPDTPALPAA
ncbi:MAG: IS256 family transposase [Acidimicrobiia bacterium]|nr:MAG: IS256 family transposase [Acidimicrobiia bacterium]